MTISSNAMERKYDHKINHHTYEPGDKVWFYNPIRRPGLCPTFDMPWKGPFVVLDKISDVLYRIKGSSNSKPKVIHHDRLKNYN